MEPTDATKYFTNSAIDGYVGEGTSTFQRYDDRWRVMSQQFKRAQLPSAGAVAH